MQSGEIAQVMLRPRRMSNKISLPTRIVVTEIRLTRSSGQSHSEWGENKLRHILPSQEEESLWPYKCWVKLALQVHDGWMVIHSGIVRPTIVEAMRLQILIISSTKHVGLYQRGEPDTWPRWSQPETLVSAWDGTAETLVSAQDPSKLGQVSSAQLHNLGVTLVHCSHTGLSSTTCF